MLYRAGDFADLVKLEIDPNSFLEAEWGNLLGVPGPDDYRAAYAATKLLSKCGDLPTGINTRRVAIESADKAENICREQNLFLRSLRGGNLRDIRGLESMIFLRAKATIAEVLGEIPGWFYDQPTEVVERRPGDRRPDVPFFKDVGWSPGRTTSASGDDVSHFGKYSSAPHCTVSASEHASRVLDDSPHWKAAACAAGRVLSGNLVQGNVMLTVPKNAKTDRVICYEPHMNIRLQLAVGGYIRERLRREADVKLDDQSINRRRARNGSTSGRLATIDLTMASDTISSELIWELLPIDWACLLDSLRSKTTVLPDGRAVRVEKFSSMGNGFTFELESLIFYALAKSQTNGRVTVMGDDLVVLSRDFDRVAYALELAGFILNRAKSFCDGLFRESCGGHYFGGLDVTPFFVRSLLKDTLDVVLLHNQIREWLQRPLPGFVPRAGVNLLKRLRRYFPWSTGPQGYGDGHYHVNIDEASGFARASDLRDSQGWEGWWFTTYQSELESYTGLRQGVKTHESDAALCTALGPKRAKRLDASHLNRRRRTVKRRRILADLWPGCWVAG